MGRQRVVEGRTPAKVARFYRGQDINKLSQPELVEAVETLSVGIDAITRSLVHWRTEARASQQALRRSGAPTLVRADAFWLFLIGLFVGFIIGAAVAL